MKNAILLLVLTLLCAACQGEGYVPETGDDVASSRQAIRGCTLPPDGQAAYRLRFDAHPIVTVALRGCGDSADFSTAEFTSVKLGPHDPAPTRGDGVASCFWNSDSVLFGPTSTAPLSLDNTCVSFRVLSCVFSRGTIAYNISAYASQARDGTFSWMGVTDLTIDASGVYSCARRIQITATQDLPGR